MAKAQAEGAGKPAPKKVFKKRGEKRVVHHGFAHIQASFNNTTITITDPDGNVVAVVERRRHRLQGLAQGDPVCRHAGRHRGGNTAKQYGLRSLEVRVKGPGAGRESAIRALQTVGIDVKSIKDITPIPHNGCRPPEAAPRLGAAGPVTHFTQGAKDESAWLDTSAPFAACAAARASSCSSRASAATPRSAPSRSATCRPASTGRRAGRSWSGYGLQLREKQKVKRIYGVLENQFRRYFEAAERTRGITGETLLQLLERRLDNVTYRLGLRDLPRAGAAARAPRALPGEREARWTSRRSR